MTTNKKCKLTIVSPCQQIDRGLKRSGRRYSQRATIKERCASKILIVVFDQLHINKILRYDEFF